MAILNSRGMVATISNMTMDMSKIRDKHELRRRHSIKTATMLGIRALSSKVEDRTTGTKNGHHERNGSMIHAINSDPNEGGNRSHTNMNRSRGNRKNNNRLPIDSI